MTFYELWCIIQEDGDLNSFNTMGDGLSPQSQYLNYDPDVTHDKGLNLKRRTWKKLDNGPKSIVPVRTGKGLAFIPPPGKVVYAHKREIST